MTRQPPGYPTTRVDPDWLAARAVADAAARQGTLDRLIPALIDHLTADGTSGELAVLDVGAGTGANQRWLRPHLPSPQRWVHLDHDPGIGSLAHPSPQTLIVTGDVGAAAEVLQTLPPGRRLLTGAALLDVLTSAQVRSLCAAATAAHAPSLFSLTVTGAWSLEPADPLDARLRAAFNDHQRRAGRAGPEPADIAAEAARAGAAMIITVETPWQLDADSDPAFVDRFLGERVAASVEQDGDLAVPAGAWLARRRGQLAVGQLQIRVGHRDLLALPAGQW